MADFKPILKRALRRKDGEQGLELWVLEPMPMATFISQPDHRFLSMMTKVIFQAGFVWRVIENKWPDFETVFLGFDTEKMMLLSPEQWEKIGTDPDTQLLLQHWQKLGQFRNKHMAVGAGVHKMISEAPYTFSRSYSEGDYEDSVLVVLDAPLGHKTVDVRGYFEDGIRVRDAYSGSVSPVKQGKVNFETNFDILLLEAF